MIDYEGSIFQEMSNDVKQSLEPQLNSISKIAEESQRLANNSDREVKILQERLLFYKEEIENAKRDARFSKVVSALSLIIAVVSVVLTIIT